MAKTILMIHGFGCAGDSWAPVAERLRAEGYRVETPTLRAEQRKVSAPGAGLADLGLADYVADMSALAASLAQQDGEAPIAFGHSMGGMIAQKLAEAGLIAGAVLFAPASPADARGRPKLSPVFAFLNAALMPSPETKTVKQWKTGFKWGVMNAVPASRHDALYSKMVFDSGRVLSNLAWPDKDPHKTATVDVDKVKVPLLVVAGALDRTTPVDDLRLVGQKYSAVGGDYVEYPNNAHWLIDEPGSDVILGDVIAWLKNKALVVAPAKPAPAAAPVAAPVVAKAPEAPAKAAAPAAAKPARPAVAKAAAPAPKAAAKPKVVAAKPAPAAKAPAKAEAKPAPAKVAAKPKAAAKAAPVAAPAKVETKAPAAKAPAKPKAAVAAKSAAAPKAETPAKAKPKAAAKPAPTKAPVAKAAAAPKVAAKAPAAAKPAATPKPAKSSPKPKKSV